MKCQKFYADALNRDKQRFYSFAVNMRKPIKNIVCNTDIIRIDVDFDFISFSVRTEIGKLPN